MTPLHDDARVPWRTLIARNDLARFQRARAQGYQPPRHALLDLFDHLATGLAGRALPEALTPGLVRWVGLLAPHADLQAPTLATTAARLQSPAVLLALRQAGMPSNTL